jgi:hypothetical protein
MKVAQLHEYGGPEVLAYEELRSLNPLRAKS